MSQFINLTYRQQTEPEHKLLSNTDIPPSAKPIEVKTLERKALQKTTV